jgi:hypothetical protein
VKTSPSAWTPPVAGLLAAAGIAWLTCPVPPPHLLSWDGLLISAAKYVLIALLASVMVVWVGYSLLPLRVAIDIRSIAWRTSAGAVWFPPLLLFLLERSMWVVGMTAVLVASLTRLFRFCQSTGAISESPKTERLVVSEIFSPIYQQAFVRRLLSPFCASICAQAGIVAGLIGYRLTAATLVGISAAVLAWSFPITGIYPETLSARASRPARRRLLLVVVLAMIFTAVGLAPFLWIDGLFGLDGKRASIVSVLLHVLFPAKGSKPAAKPGPPPDPGNRPGGGTYSGVIVWPETDPHAVMLVVPPAEPFAGLFRAVQNNPLSIPFAGVYWFFKPPDTRPPERSFKTRGSPAKMGLHSSDQYPLLMEAHQNFGALVNLNCCSKIQVVIGNADRYPGTASLELVLANTTLGRKTSQSLGTMMVKSTAPGGPDDDRQPVEEVLTFDIPSSPAIRQFNAMTIRFRLDDRRANASARIEIKRFVFVPRGR